MSGRAALRLAPLDAASAGAGRLLAASDAYLGQLYPAESNHLEPVDGLQQANVLFLGAWCGEVLAGCGAVKRLADDGVYGELKRLFVWPDWRGQQIGQALVGALERHLLTAGIEVARLETGIHQPEALRLYARLGYRPRPPFGAYRPDPLSLFLERRLG